MLAILTLLNSNGGGYEGDASQKQYLLLVSLRELVTTYVDKGEKSLARLEEIVEPLLAIARVEPEANRMLVSECLGNLCCIYPESVLSRLESIGTLCFLLIIQYVPNFHHYTFYS